MLAVFGADADAVAAAVYGWMMDRMPKFQARQISGAVHSISRLQLYNAELVGALVQVRRAASGFPAAFDAVSQGIDL